MTEEELPSGWMRILLGEAATTTSGGTPSRKNPAFFAGSIPWIKSGELPDGAIRVVSEKLSKEGLRNSAARIVPPGTLMIAMYGATVGKLGISTFPACTNQAVCSITPIGLRDRGFLYFFFLSIRHKLIDDAKGGAQPNISQEIVRRIGVPTPPLNEQRRIVERIDELFSQIEAGEAALARAKRLLARYRQAVLKAAVTGELTKDWRERHQAEIEPATLLLTRILQARREAWEKAELEKLRTKGKPSKNDSWKKKYKEPEPPDTTDLPELPEGWVWASWQQLGFSQNGKPFPSQDYQAGGIRLMRPGNLTADGRVSWTAKNTACLPEKWLEDRPELLLGEGDIVMNLTAQSLADDFLGRVCLLGADDHSLLNQRLARLTPILVDKAFPDYV